MSPCKAASLISGCIRWRQTRLGCGYDFKLRLGEEEDFLAVEVKGLMDQTRTISFTPKEHAVAEELEARFVLFVVKNFREEPYHENLSESRG